ncbi:protein of unknown function [Raineyella antarctica]|uniref:DUF948 domain-containing protein n=1 Tax=Raineyella antarctica TaxID=1577474 RepID=A0A1G6HL28_9ACTN|nr:DUF948 domain-containing protein [Raineyella antarctica]SDB94156.1 protein of unknown function [Raineyella antarctica]
MTVGAIAGLIAALAALLLVGFLARPLLKLARVLEEVRLVVRDFGHSLVPIMSELRGTVTAANSEIEKVGLITEDASRVTANASTVARSAAELATLFSATVGGPLVKTAAFSYGIRSAMVKRRKHGVR